MVEAALEFVAADDTPWIVDTVGFIPDDLVEGIAVVEIRGTPLNTEISFIFTFSVDDTDEADFLVTPGEFDLDDCLCVGAGIA